MIRVKMCIIVSCASFGVNICNNVHIVFILQCLRDYIVYIYTFYMFTYLYCNHISNIKMFTCL